jgi:hypothetical protein
MLPMLGKEQETVMQALETPHNSSKRSCFGTKYSKTPPPKKSGNFNGDPEGCRLGLTPAPD